MNNAAATVAPGSSIGRKVVFRNTLTNDIVVSTICYREGRSLNYETAIIVNGRTSDSIRTASKDRASCVHDTVGGIAAGFYKYDLYNSYHDTVIKMYADAAGYAD